jgi:hypothetical protein
MQLIFLKNLAPFFFEWYSIKNSGGLMLGQDKIDEIVQEFREVLQGLSGRMATGRLRYGVTIEINLSQGNPGKNFIEKHFFRESMKSNKKT